MPQKCNKSSNNQWWQQNLQKCISENTTAQSLKQGRISWYALATSRGTWHYQGLHNKITHEWLLTQFKYILSNVMQRTSKIHSRFLDTASNTAGNFKLTRKTKDCRELQDGADPCSKSLLLFLIQWRRSERRSGSVLRGRQAESSISAEEEEGGANTEWERKEDRRTND